MQSKLDRDSASSFTHSLQAFLLLPILFSPTTSTFLPDTQSSLSALTFLLPKPSQSTMPHHLSHTLNTQTTVQTSLRFLSFRDTPHIHLTIIRSALSRLCRFSAFIAHVSVSYGSEAENQLPLKRFLDSSVSSLISWWVWKAIPPPKSCSNTHGWITG